jgi:hypothetical protein
MLIDILCPALPYWRSYSSYRIGHDVAVSWLFDTEDNAWVR